MINYKMDTFYKVSLDFMDVNLV